MALDRASSVSNLAHLAGFVAGYIALKLIAKKDILWDPFKNKSGSEKKQTFSDSGKQNESCHTDSKNAGPVSNAELDALLDKVSQKGINSLTEYELARLRQAREEMRNR